MSRTAKDKKRIQIQIAREVRKSNIPEIKDPRVVERYLLENGGEGFDQISRPSKRQPPKR
jgi:hypothetical protein